MSAASPQDHVPVLLTEVVEALAPRDGGTYVDGTFGAGGYTRAVLAAADCRVIGIDRDPGAVQRGQALAALEHRFEMIAGRFGDLKALISRPIDGIVFDIGVSSMQLDEAERGFSFMADGPLDMRMEGAASTDMSAADLVNHASEAELADIFYHLGEERAARRVARALIAARAIRPIERTAALADIIARAIGRAEPGRHPSTRCFQALRIKVNDELGQLVQGLVAAEHLLPEGGRLAVVTFHSLEDRIVKRFFLGNETTTSRHRPIVAAPDRRVTFNPLFKGHCGPGAAEIERNPRARSAKLRAGRRTAAPARSIHPAELGLPPIVEVSA